MLNWFSTAGTAIRAGVISAAVIVGVALVAVPTALITSAVTSQTQADTPTSQALPNQASPSPLASKLVSSTDSATTNPSPQESVSSPKVSKSQQESSQDSVTPNNDSAPVITVPGAPSNFVLAGGGCDVVGCGREFTFTPPTSDGGSPITSYQAGFSFDGGATWQYANATLEGNGSYIAGIDGAPGIPNVGCVRALNAVGAGPCSNIFRTVG